MKSLTDLPLELLVNIAELAEIGDMMSLISIFDSLAEFLPRAIVTHTDHDDNTLLHLGAAQGDERLVRVLLAKGSNLHAETGALDTNSPYTWLSHGATSPSQECAGALTLLIGDLGPTGGDPTHLSKGSSINSPDIQERLLRMTYGTGNLGIVRLILRDKASVEGPAAPLYPAGGGWHAPPPARYVGYEEAVSMLMAAGAKLWVVDLKKVSTVGSCVSNALFRNYEAASYFKHAELSFLSRAGARAQNNKQLKDWLDTTALL
ncbi:hypothetical protein AJ80_03112 [Polytolypa hystricis UAMH7299]|uniref:Uncharacterized protein n=1 Tax=Polytolypa hystricis (strain UAMH7299) TaxID=1447883 RepID=A0A2B7YL24_POLH7|nr:hypothetical protein AJ80_03112 [Polytolypa hystricis UAMH7299]